MPNSIAFVLMVYTSVCMNIRRKNCTPCVLPFTVTQGHRNWHGSIGYIGLRLLINVPQQPSVCLVPFPRYFEILAENCEFSPLNRCLTPPRGVSLEFCNGAGSKKTRMTGLPGREYSLIITRGSGLRFLTAHNSGTVRVMLPPIWYTLPTKSTTLYRLKKVSKLYNNV